VKNYYTKHYTFALIIFFFIFTSFACMAEEIAGVTSSIAIHNQRQHLENRDDIQNNNLYHERIIPWSSHSKISETSIRVYFSADSEECHGHRAILQESDDAITIAIVQGALSDAKEYHCNPVGRTASFLLHTQNPIGSRKIVQEKFVELRRKLLKTQ